MSTLLLDTLRKAELDQVRNVNSGIIRVLDTYASSSSFIDHLVFLCLVLYQVKQKTIVQRYIIIFAQPLKEYLCVLLSFLNPLSFSTNGITQLESLAQVS